MLDGIRGRFSYGLGRLAVLLGREGRLQAGDGGRIELLGPEGREGADERELGLGMVPLAAPQALDVEPFAVCLGERQQGVVQAQELGGRDASAGVVEVGHHVLPPEAVGQDTAKGGNENGRVVTRGLADGRVHQSHRDLLLA